MYLGRVLDQRPPRLLRGRVISEEEAVEQLLQAKDRHMASSRVILGTALLSSASRPKSSNSAQRSM